MMTLSRSEVLTRGQRWRLFGINIATIAIAWGIQVVMNLVSLMLGVSLAEPTQPFQLAIIVLESGIGGLIGATWIASAYVELLRIKGGVSAQSTAEIFA